MRKSLALFIVMLVFAIGGTCYVSVSLLKEKDNVQITENVVYGDKAIVEGVTVERNIKYDRYIRWNTTYVVGEEPKCDTVYTFDELGGLREETIYTYDGIELYTNVIRGFDDADEKAEDLSGVDRAMKELFDETEPGQESSMIIDLADYLDFYEYEVFIELPEDIFYAHINKEDIEEAIAGYSSSSNEAYVEKLRQELHLVENLTEFFKIPVIENHLYEITVAKDMAGNLHGWSYGGANGGGSSGNVSMGANLQDADGFNLWTMSAYTEDACYFTFDPYTDDGKLVDTSYIPGGYGIYCLPYDKENRTIDVDNLSMVYAMDPKEATYNLKYDEKRNALLLFREKEEGSVMTVIDADTMEEKQEIVYTEEGYSAGFYSDEEFVLLDYGENIMLLSIDESGLYQKEMECDLTWLLEDAGVGYLDFSYMDFDWNGEKLIMTDSLRNDDNSRYYQNCGFYLAAYDETGLLYYGEYESSLDTKGSYECSYYDKYYGYNYICRPTDNDPIKISW